MIEHLQIKSQRQKRAINVLIDKASIEVKDLGILIGALNPRQIIFELRQLGFENIIKTQFFEKKDRDGKRCRPGRYFIPPEFKPIVQAFLERDGLGAVPNKSKCKTTNDGSKHYDREEV